MKIRDIREVRTFRIKLDFSNKFKDGIPSNQVIFTIDDLREALSSALPHLRVLDFSVLSVERRRSMAIVEIRAVKEG